MRYHGVRATRAALVLAVAAALAATMTPSGGAAAPQPGAAAKSGVTAEKKPNYDARSGGLAAAGARRSRAGQAQRRRPCAASPARHPGDRPIDPLTAHAAHRRPGQRLPHRAEARRPPAASRSATCSGTRTCSGCPAGRSLELSLRKTYRRRRRHPAPELRAAGARHPGVRQRAARPRHRTTAGCSRSTARRWPGCRATSAPRASAPCAARRLAIRDTFGACARTGTLARTGADRATSFRNGDSARWCCCRPARASGWDGRP